MKGGGGGCARVGRGLGRRTTWGPALGRVPYSFVCTRAGLSRCEGDLVCPPFAGRIRQRFDDFDLFGATSTKTSANFGASSPGFGNKWGEFDETSAKSAKFESDSGEVGAMSMRGYVRKLAPGQKMAQEGHHHKIARTRPKRAKPKMAQNRSKSLGRRRPCSPKFAPHLSDLGRSCLSVPAHRRTSEAICCTGRSGSHSLRLG